MTQDAGRDSAASLGSGPVDAGDFALARALAEYLHESSALRHGLFTPVQFKDIVFARIMDFLKRQRACDSELLRTVSRPGAVLTVRAVTIPAKIQASITAAIRGARNE